MPWSHSAVTIAEVKRRVIAHQTDYFVSVRKRVVAGTLTPAQGKLLMQRFASNASEASIDKIFGPLYQKWAEGRVASVSENDWFRLFIQTCEGADSDDPKGDD